MPFLHIGAMAFAVSLAFCGFMVHAGVGDIPNARSNHNSATPTSGGAGLVAALGVMALGAALFYPQLGTAPELPVLLGLALIIAAIGLYDDVFTGRTAIKFALIIGVASVAVRYIGPPDALPFGANDIQLPYWLSFAGSVLWIFVCVNGINFMDGANGLMASFMFIASLALMMLAAQMGAITTAILAGALTFGLLGFLPYNFKKNAQIFCGDVGSLLVGFIFAIAALMLAKEAPDFRPLYLGPLLLLPFLADILMTMATRLRAKENLLAPHSAHLYQRLIRSGWSHAQVSWTYAAAGVICANLAMFAVFSGLIASLWGLLMLAVIAGVVKAAVQKRFN